MSTTAVLPAAKDRRAYSLFAPWDVQAIFDDGLRHHRAGQVEEAMERYKRAISLQPDFADAHNNLGVALASQGRIDDAVAQYERALFLKPDCADTRSNLGVALAAKGRFADAIVHYERVLAQNPGHAGTHYNLGIALAAEGKTNEAVAHYKRTLILKPDYGWAHNNLGTALAAQGDTDGAMAHYARAIAINPHNAAAHNNLGNILREQGKFDDAMAHYERAIAISPADPEAHFHRAEIKFFRKGDAELAALEALAGSNRLPPDKAQYIHFALAKALEDIGEYPAAFEQLRKGNASKRGQIHYDEPGVAANFQRISTVFDSRLLDRLQGRGDRSSVPVFVVGMPRSGSTLIEQILASHPQIHGAGELPDLEKAASTISVPALDGITLRRIGMQYLAGLPVIAGGKVRIVDKLPGNFLNIGLIRLALPNARIIHTTRDPIDTCVSCYSKLFTSGQDFSYDMGELGRYYRHYRDLMTHWKSVLPPDVMLEVAYEDIVDDLEGQARRLIEYCGLPWDDRCLSFQKTNRPVKTASAVQIRKPLFRTSLQRWRKYEANLGPLLQELDKLTAQDCRHVRAANAG